MEGKSPKKSIGRTTPKKKSNLNSKNKKKMATAKDNESIDINKTKTNQSDSKHRKTLTPDVSKFLAYSQNLVGTSSMKYVFVCGGTMSGLGKGVTVSSLGAILQNYGFKITTIKIDPYINQDAGTMSPFEHGEVYVLEDGSEVDLDLGNYERYLDIHLSGVHNLTTGKIYAKVIEAERKGDYLGKTVQVVPHITNAIMDWISMTSEICVDRKDTTKMADI